VPTTIDPTCSGRAQTCGPAFEECPVDIEHIDAIIDMRRYEVADGVAFSLRSWFAAAQYRDQGDPWVWVLSKRTDWLAALDFEVPIIDGRFPRNVEYSTGLAVPDHSTTGPQAGGLDRSQCCNRAA